MEVDVIKEGNERRKTGRDKMRERKKEIRKYEKEKERKGQQGRARVGGVDKIK
jgi:hypothetical protein